MKKYTSNNDVPKGFYKLGFFQLFQLLVIQAIRIANTQESIATYKIHGESIGYTDKWPVPKRNYVSAVELAAKDIQKQDVCDRCEKVVKPKRGWYLACPVCDSGGTS